MSPTPPFDVNKAHRWFAIELNNTSWDLLESPDELSADDKERLVHQAHASVYHWMHAGNVANRSRGENLLAYAYSHVGLGEAAVRHARRCVELVEANQAETEDWDLAFAYDCFARATAVSGDLETAETLKQRARELGDQIAGEEDKKMFDNQHSGGNWHGLNA